MMGRRDPHAELRWALVTITNQLTDEAIGTVKLSRSEARAVLTAARVANLPTDDDALSARLMSAEDRAAFWERRCKEAEGRERLLIGTTEIHPDSTRFT